MRYLDCMTFNGKPDQPDDVRVDFEAEFNLSLTDEQEATGKSSTWTIEPQSIYDRMATLTADHVLLNIERLKAGLDRTSADATMAQYARLGKAAARPGQLVSLWDIRPDGAAGITRSSTAWRRWSADWMQRRALVDSLDYGALGMYSNRRNNMTNFRAFNQYVVPEARRLYDNKPVYIFLSPHPYGAAVKGQPWPMHTYDEMNQMIDFAEAQRPDGVGFWSYQPPANRNNWDTATGALRAIKERWNSWAATT